MEILIPKYNTDSKKIINVDMEQLCNAISNTIFKQYESNTKPLGDITYWDLASILPSIIANEIIDDRNDIFLIK